jgi:anaphase-promoting complex subunit 4
MPPTSFTLLATARLAAQSRVYANSCCPDKDLVVLFSRLGGNDRMSLWNINQGIRKWETDIGDSDAGATAVAMDWSPDGMFFFFAKHGL